MTTRILLTEDDDGIRARVEMALKDAGFEVDACESGESALVSFGRRPPELLLVGLMLRGIDGFALITEIRRHSQAPIIVLSARRDPADIVRALEIGADDYVTKPFDDEVLIARIHALLRRVDADEVGDSADGLILDTYGPLVLDDRAGMVLRGETDIRLTTTEYRLLTEMARSAGRVLSRQLLLDRVWGHDYFGDERLVDVHVSRLRTKIERDPSDPTIVVTVRGQGYRLDLPPHREAPPGGPVDRD
ncbi:MAG: response regulator transcription factor [Dermatophilaceae bacterium]